MAKRYYKVKEKVWIKELKRKGIVQSLDVPNLQAEVSYFADSGNLGQKTFSFTEIDKLLTGVKENENKKKLTILIKYFDKDMEQIKKIEKGDWIDLRSAIDVEYKAGDFIKLPLGVAMSLPFDHEAHVAPRSSTFKNFGVIQTNSVAAIDESFKGDDDQWFYPIYALRDGKIEKGDRICQFRIMKKMEPVNLVTVDKLTGKNRGGHGTTGKK